MSEQQSSPTFISIAASKSVVAIALKLAFIVGTILVLINQSDAIFQQSLGQENIVQIVLTYLVPYCVSTYSSVRAIQNHSA